LRRLLSLGALVLFGLTSCRTSSETIPTSKVGLDVGLYVMEGDSYRNVHTGETLTEAEEIAWMLEDGNTADDDFLPMVQSVGGFREYSELLNTLSFEENKALHAKFGVGYAVEASSPDIPKDELVPSQELE